MISVFVLAQNALRIGYIRRDINIVHGTNNHSRQFFTSDLRVRTECVVFITIDDTSVRCCCYSACIPSIGAYVFELASSSLWSQAKSTNNQSCKLSAGDVAVWLELSVSYTVDNQFVSQKLNVCFGPVGSYVSKAFAVFNNRIDAASVTFQRCDRLIILSGEGGWNEAQLFRSVIEQNTRCLTGINSFRNVDGTRYISVTEVNCCCFAAVIYCYDVEVYSVSHLSSAQCCCSCFKIIGCCAGYFRDGYFDLHVLYFNSESCCKIIQFQYGKRKSQSTIAVNKHDRFAGFYCVYQSRSRKKSNISGEIQRNSVIVRQSTGQCRCVYGTVAANGDRSVTSGNSAATATAATTTVIVGRCGVANSRVHGIVNGHNAVFVNRRIYCQGSVSITYIQASDCVEPSLAGSYTLL
ncbi:hypothetical protein SK3146_03179 [Paenibacillus konkukensis]|uniref:Uncharacterized protein n=1 Tax=Paenibacillus konkukensis TaxID=2020716 RepID=A0ABY4RNC3_9BACL|nr:hypothetical protein SK3146_03179 [Paenibacillus konkukensis]